MGQESGSVLYEIFMKSFSEVLDSLSIWLFRARESPAQSLMVSSNWTQVQQRRNPVTF
jgi:hypothetical protein